MTFVNWTGWHLWIPLCAGSGITQRCCIPFHQVVTVSRELAFFNIWICSSFCTLSLVSYQHLLCIIYVMILVIHLLFSVDLPLPVLFWFLLFLLFLPACLSVWLHLGLHHLTTSWSHYKYCIWAGFHVKAVVGMVVFWQQDKIGRQAWSHCFNINKRETTGQFWPDVHEGQNMIF